MNEIIPGLLIIAAALLLAGMGNRPTTIKRKHRGLELKAKNGRLVHVRQTESEKEIL